MPCHVKTSTRLNGGRGIPIRAKSKLPVQAGRTSARAFGRRSPIRQSESRVTAHDNTGPSTGEPNPPLRSARRAVAQTQPADAQHPKRGWIVPLFAGAAAITALTWMDTDVLRGNGAGGRAGPAGTVVSESISPGMPVRFRDSLSYSEFADPLRSGGTGPAMVVVTPGSARVGCWPGNCSDPAAPAREVTVSSSFALAKLEVTVAHYLRFSAATGRSSHLPREWLEALPVVNVSWDDAAAYAQWLSAETNRTYRLPSETEWDYVAAAVASADRDGTIVSGSYPVGAKTVGSRHANAWGLHDMAGNVSEWVAGCGERGPAPTGCTGRIRRGGSWINPAANTRASLRQVSGAAFRSMDTGFRVAAVVE